jgi:vacuolar-type H+-ATPase subunit F/Vma7
MSKAIFIGSDYFSGFFNLLGFSTYAYKGDCNNAIDFIEKNIESAKIVVLSRMIEPACINIIMKRLESQNVNYIIIPELSDIEKENIDEYYDRIIKTLIGM